MMHKVPIREDICMGAEWNSGPILGKINRLLPWSKQMIRAKFHLIISKNASFMTHKVPIREDICMGAWWNSGPMLTKISRLIPWPKQMTRAKFHLIICKNASFMTHTVSFREDIYMGAWWNSGPILTKINRLLPWPKQMIRAKFHPIIFKNATYSLRQRIHGQPASRRTDGRTDGRTDMLKSTQKVILSRTVYIKVGVGIVFRCVTNISTNPIYPLHLRWYRV